jgi:hypothetical protein
MKRSIRLGWVWAVALAAAALSAPAVARADGDNKHTSALIDVIEVAPDGGKSEAHYSFRLDDRPAMLEARGPTYSDRLEVRVEPGKGQLALLNLNLKRARGNAICEVKVSSPVKERTQVASLAIGGGPHLEVYATVR